MASRQPSSQVSRQQTASPKLAANSPSALQRIMPEVPSTPTNAGRLSLRDALLAKLLKKYSPVYFYVHNLTQCYNRDNYRSKSLTTKRTITLSKR
jgi:hypothetical protein